MAHIKVRNQTRKFNGKIFELTGVYEKRFAEMSARSFRDGGQKARVVKVSNGYAVYRRQV